MSFSLSRVPKRVALTALHGLVVGTSCTLLFVCEDRRRRIDQARRAVHNAEKVRAAKQYRKKPSPLEEEKEATAGQDTQTQALSTTLRETTVGGREKPPSTRLQSQTSPSSTTTTPPPPMIVDPYKQTKIKIRQIKEAVALGDAHSLHVGILTLKRIAGRPETVGEEDQPKLVQAAANLYRKCNDVGSTDQAVRILEYISKIGPISSAEYYAMSRNHIERAITELEVHIRQLKSQESAKAEASLVAVEKLDKLLALLVPESQEGIITSSRKWDWSSQAERTIRLALDLGAIRKHRHGVTKSEAFIRVIQTWVQLQGTLSNADPVVWNAIGNVIADAAQLGSSPDPTASLLYLAACCPPDLSIRTVWVMKLLTVDWQQFNKTKDLPKSLHLFAQFEDLGGCDKVTHLDGVYRVMIELALDAKEWQVADDFLAKLTAIKPHAANDPKIIGLLAKTKAKLGDWESVWKDLAKIEPKDDHLGDVFVPILKEYSKTHTVRQVDNFLRMALEELQVPITPYLVTLVGNRYGELRDVASLLTWLEYCAGQGVKVDAAFGNTILRNARRYWDFDYQAQKRLYRTLQALHPSFVDEVTQNMIVSAALTATRRVASPLYTHHEVTSLAVQFRSKAKPSDPHDMRLWMRRAFALRNYRLVQNMYEKAIKQGAFLDDGHLLLNVRAILLHTANLPKIVRILQEAKEQNISVERATAEVFTFYIRRVFAGDLTDKETVLQNVQGVLSQLQTAALDVSCSSLLRVAYLCLSKINHIEGALNFALSALHLKQAECPDDVPMVQVFLLAYTAKTDIRGLRWTIRGASEAGILHKERVMEALRASRRSFLNRNMQTFAVQEAIQLLDRALGLLRSNRLDMSQEREQMEKATMSIMANAAWEVALPPIEATKAREKALTQVEKDMQQLAACDIP